MKVMNTAQSLGGPMKILNVAAGKISYLKGVGQQAGSGTFLVNIDSMYYNYTPTDIIESRYYEWTKPGKHERKDETHYCKEDIFQFLERTTMEFDMVTIYRFLEHVSFTQVLYFIYLISTVVRKGGMVDIIVPNYEKLANMILQENINDINFERKNILLTTELLNEPSCPHASIWTPQRAKYFWEFEDRFTIYEELIWETFEYDRRDIYLRFHLKRK